MVNENKQSNIQNTTEQPIPAGCFSSWLRRARYNFLKENGVEVNCGECKACCSSSYFIHIRPEETETKARIPKALLFAAPGLPKGNVLLGYDQHGCCPMLINGKCSIYEHRPATCRNYDCRIFTAAGITADEAGKELINRQIGLWKFDYPTKRDLDLHIAIQKAALFLKEHAESFPAGFIPSNTTQLAVLAIKVYPVFYHSNDEFSNVQSPSEVHELVHKIMEELKKFEANIGKFSA